jgi:hypothetical protein
MGLPLTATPGSLPDYTTIFNDGTRPAIAGMVLWLDAMSSDSIWDASVASLALEGAVVGLWEDISGCGNHAIMNNSATAPTLVANGINSKPALQFTQSFLRFVNGQIFNGLTGFTFMAVFRSDTTVSKSHVFGIAGSTVPGRGIDYSSHLDYGGTTLENLGTSNRVSLGSSASLGLAPNKNHLFCITGDASDMTRVYMNGTQVTTYAYGSRYTEYWWMIGRTFGVGIPNAELFQGWIGEIKIYTYQLNATQLQTETAAMLSKWQIV